MILYAQFNVNNSIGNDWSHPGRRSALIWLLIEIIASYSYILSAMLLLVCISLKGIFKNDQQYNQKDRYKFDALEYYNVDVDWFAFIIIMLNLTLFTSCAEHL